MPATAAIANKNIVGNVREHTGVMNLGAYATGGVPITPALFGLWRLQQLDMNSPALVAGTPRHLAVDYVNSKVMAFVAAGTEVPNATDLSTMPIRFAAKGTG